MRGALVSTWVSVSLREAPVGAVDEREVGLIQTEQKLTCAWSAVATGENTSQTLIPEWHWPPGLPLPLSVSEVNL